MSQALVYTVFAALFGAVLMYAGFGFASLVRRWH